jgi:hypothetical protein
MIGLSEDDDLDRYAKMGFTPLRGALGELQFRNRYGMPFAPARRTTFAASSPACRAVVAARREWPGSERAVFRALQLAHFNTPLLWGDPEQLREILSQVDGVDADRLVELLDDDEVVAEYHADKARARTAAGSPTELQGKAADNGDGVRYTAPSVIFETADGRVLEAGGFQPAAAYDVVIANLDPTLSRQGVPEDVGELLDYFSYGLTTAEVAAVLTASNDEPDRAAAEKALLALVFDGAAERHPLGDDALWTRPGVPGPPRLSAGTAAVGA